VIHYEGLATLDGAQTNELAGQGLIIDECHYAKNRIALRSKAVRELAKRCKHVLCLTGTLVRNDVRDVWHPSELAVPGHLGSYAMFEAKYAEFRQFRRPTMRRPVKQFSSSKNEQQLANKLSEIMVRRKKVDVVNLPLKQRVVIPLDLDKESGRIYREMKQRAMAEIAADPKLVGQLEFDRTPSLVYSPTELPNLPRVSLIARTALEQAIRLEQITNGIVGGSNLEEPVAIAESAKLAWVVETINDLHAEGRSCVVFCKFNATVGRLLMQLPTAHVLTGDTPAHVRGDVIQCFREKAPDAPLFCQLRLAEGFDLTPCTDAIFLGIDWTPAMMDQAEDRLHRIGTTGQVTCYYPLMRKTIDERLYRVVMEKREDARRVLGDVSVMREELQAV
jgi:SNF2 family DNA or RNA helicase